MSSIKGGVPDRTSISIPCPKCGQKPFKFLRELVSQDNTACNYCGGIIDLRTDMCQALIGEAVELAKQVGKPLSG